MTQQQEKSEMNICYSGGAEGADALFGKCAEAVGHKVCHYSFDGHKGPNLFKLSTMELLEADPYLIEANNKYIHRRFPTSQVYSNNLLRRNYYQIRDTDRVYAVASLDERGIPQGGTAWAVVMAAQKFQTRSDFAMVYLFEDTQKSWFYLKEIGQDKRFKWGHAKYLPHPEGKYTGIGSRVISKEAESAIKLLFGIV